MTLRMEYSPVIAVGNGSTREFGYTFDEVSSEYLKVSFWKNNAWVEQLSGWHKVDGVSTIMFDYAPEKDTRIAIERQVPYSQDVPFYTSSGFQAAVIEKLFDKAVALVQQVKDTTSRCVKTEVGGQSPEELLKDIFDGFDKVEQTANELRALCDEVKAIKTEVKGMRDETVTAVTSASGLIDELNAIAEEVKGYGDELKNGFYTKTEIDEMIGDVETLINNL